MTTPWTRVARAVLRRVLVKIVRQGRHAQHKKEHHQGEDDHIRAGDEEALGRDRLGGSSAGAPSFRHPSDCPGSPILGLRRSAILGIRILRCGPLLQLIGLVRHPQRRIAALPAHRFGYRSRRPPPALDSNRRIRYKARDQATSPSGETAYRREKGWRKQEAKGPPGLASGACALKRAIRLGVLDANRSLAKRLLIAGKNVDRPRLGGAPPCVGRATPDALFRPGHDGEQLRATQVHGVVVDAAGEGCRCDDPAAR